MKYAFIHAERSCFEAEEMCRVLGVTRSGYYRWRQARPGKRAHDNALLLSEITAAHEESKRIYGSPRITKELRDKGIRCGKNRVARIMKDRGIRSKIKRKWKATTNSKHSLPVADNLLKQDFSAASPDERYVSDITYIWTQEGWLYLSIILDLHSRMIVGWSMNDRMTDDLVLNALDMAYTRRQPGSGVIFHSDRGSQYASRDVRAKLASYGFVSSMSRKGNCFDNACAESFFHTLKTELVNFERYRTREEARQSIFHYIEVFYNRIRKHSSIGYKSPVQFEELRYLQQIDLPPK